jgi:hypothetical protein
MKFSLILAVLILSFIIALAVHEPPIQPYSPKGQARDFKICKDAGMGARLDFWNIVRCDPQAIMRPAGKGANE